MKNYLAILLVSFFTYIQSEITQIYDPLNKLNSTSRLNITTNVADIKNSVGYSVWVILAKDLKSFSEEMGIITFSNLKNFLQIFHSSLSKRKEGCDIIIFYDIKENKLQVFLPQLSYFSSKNTIGPSMKVQKYFIEKDYDTVFKILVEEFKQVMQNNRFFIHSIIYGYIAFCVIMFLLAYWCRVCKLRSSAKVRLTSLFLKMEKEFKENPLILETKCGICFEELKEDFSLKFDCKHNFHNHCYSGQECLFCPMPPKQDQISWIFSNILATNNLSAKKINGTSIDKVNSYIDVKLIDTISKRHHLRQNNSLDEIYNKIDSKNLGKKHFD